MVSKYELLRQPLTILVISNSQVFLVILLVSLGCPHKVPQMWQFKTIEVDHLTFLKAQSTKSSRTMLSLKPVQGSFLASFYLWWWLSTLGVPCLEAAPQSLPLSSHVIICLFPSSHNCILSKIHVILSQGPTPLQYELTLNNYTCNNPDLK